MHLNLGNYSSAFGGCAAAAWFDIASVSIAAIIAF
jgi:hypothetical protein